MRPGSSPRGRQQAQGPRVTREDDALNRLGPSVGLWQEGGDGRGLARGQRARGQQEQGPVRTVGRGLAGLGRAEPAGPQARGRGCLGRRVGCGGTGWGIWPPKQNPSVELAVTASQISPNVAASLGQLASLCGFWPHPRAAPPEGWKPEGPLPGETLAAASCCACPGLPISSRRVGAAWPTRPRVWTGLHGCQSRGLPCCRASGSTRCTGPQPP